MEQLRGTLQWSGECLTMFKAVVASARWEESVFEENMQVVVRVYSECNSRGIEI